MRRDRPRVESDEVYEAPVARKTVTNTVYVVTEYLQAWLPDISLLIKLVRIIELIHCWGLN
jgi:hypothetical protein